jgi:hypothetical protein
MNQNFDPGIRSCRYSVQKNSIMKIQYGVFKFFELFINFLYKIFVSHFLTF